MSHDLEADALAKESAYNWIQRYGEELSGYDYSSENQILITADELIDCAMRVISEKQNGEWASSYICHGGLLEGVGVSDEFWMYLGIYAGFEIPEELRESFFTCSC